MEARMQVICDQTTTLTDDEFRVLMNKLFKNSKRSFNVMNKITNDFSKIRKKEIKEFNRSKMPANPNPTGQPQSHITSAFHSDQIQQVLTKKQKKKKGKGKGKGQQGQGQQVQGQQNQQVQQMMTDSDYLF